MFNVQFGINQIGDLKQAIARFAKHQTNGENGMSKFKFEPLDVGYKVTVKGKTLGEIKPMKEATGRHCFYLGFDKRKSPRTYRGKIKAAEALEAINKLMSDSKKKRWSTEALIVNAWDERPRASDQW